jgi:hypothetical protein
VQGETGTVGFTLTNTGSSATPTLTATITLPNGVSLVSTVKGIDTGGSGWSCKPTDAGAVCTYPALTPGASTTLALQVLVAPEAPVGSGPVAITIEGKQVDPVTVPDNRTVESASNGTTSSSR